MLIDNPHERKKYSKIIKSWDKIFNKSLISMDSINNTFAYDYLDENDDLSEDLIKINIIRGARRL